MAYFDNLENLGLATSRVIPEEEDYFDQSANKVQKSQKNFQKSPLKIAKRKSRPKSQGKRPRTSDVSPTRKSQKSVAKKDT